MTSVSKSCFALISVGLLVATSGAQAKTKSVIVNLPAAANCPISMRARHGMDGSMIAISGKARHGIGQQIELTLNNPGKAAISAIRITVHGWNGKGSMLPAREMDSKDATASRTLELKVSIAPHETAKADVWVSGLTSVNSIDLIEVQYAKGLNWRVPEAHACRIVPDAETLISHR